MIDLEGPSVKHARDVVFSGDAYISLPRADDQADDQNGFQIRDSRTR